MDDKRLGNYKIPCALHWKRISLEWKRQGTVERQLFTPYPEPHPIQTKTGFCQRNIFLIWSAPMTRLVILKRKATIVQLPGWFCHFILSLCVWGFCLYVCLWSMWVQCPWLPEDNTRSLRTGVTDDWTVPYGCWKLNPGHLEKQTMLLIAEPSLWNKILPF